MKISHFIFLALFGLFVASVACNSKKEEQPATEQNTLSPDVGTLSTEAPTTEATPISGGTTTEPHYKCPKNCEGGVGTAQGKCPVCGSDLVHNAAFHAQAAAQPGTSPTTPITINPTNATAPGTSPATAQQPAQPAAAQNAKGEWHFVCSKACGGGAGAAGNCPKCSSILEHNQAYHQQ